MVERVFEPFYTTKEAPRVVGLGLSVAHGVVEAHSGEIDIDTEPGEGTTVRVYLPKDND
jgi:signal transduction histidine kinase